MALPIFNGVDEKLIMLQTRWAAIINPFLARPMNQSMVIPAITLAVGDNVINHRLGRRMQGWFLTDIQSPAVIYRNAPFNDLTITLNSDAIATISLGVF